MISPNHIVLCKLSDTVNDTKRDLFLAFYEGKDLVKGTVLADVLNALSSGWEGTTPTVQPMATENLHHSLACVDLVTWGTRVS